MSCARLAERVVALICCEKLHKIGKNWKSNLFVKVYFIVEKLHMICMLYMYTSFSCRHLLQLSFACLVLWYSHVLTNLACTFCKLKLNFPGKSGYLTNFVLNSKSNFTTRDKDFGTECTCFLEDTDCRSGHPTAKRTWFLKWIVTKYKIHNPEFIAFSTMF